MQCCAVLHSKLIVVAVALGSLVVAGCGSKTGGLIAETTQEAKSCISTVTNKSEYSILKASTNIEMPHLINADMIANKSFATKDEAVALKNLYEDAAPCKRRIFDGYVTLAPDLQLVLIKAEIRGKKNYQSLMDRKITWGKFNQEVINNIAALSQEARPALQRLQARVNLEERQAAIARQQALQALAILADTALTLHAISEASRPVVTSCMGGVGTISCVSR